MATAGPFYTSFFGTAYGHAGERTGRCLQPGPEAIQVHSRTGYIAISPRATSRLSRRFPAPVRAGENVGDKTRLGEVLERRVAPHVLRPPVPPAAGLDGNERCDPAVLSARPAHWVERMPPILEG